jgi:hypothetical protein
MSSTAYSNYDLTSAASRIQDILSGLPLNTSSFRSAALSQYASNKNAATAVSDITRAQVEKDVTSEFVSMTDVMAQMNEAVNSNVYLFNAMLKELSRVGKLDDSAKRGIYKVRQEFLYVSYLTEYYKLMINIVIYTTIVTLILLTLTSVWRMGKLPDVLFYIICAVVLSIYAVSMFFIFKHAAHRRNYQWNKFYWKAGGDVRRAQEEASLGSGSGSYCPSAPTAALVGSE